MLGEYSPGDILRIVGYPEINPECVLVNAAGSGSLLGTRPGGRARDSSRNADLNEAAMSASALAIMHLSMHKSTAKCHYDWSMNRAAEDQQTSQVWDQLAKAYAGSRQVSADNLIEWPAQRRMVGDVHGLHVLDVGCGTGNKARFFAESGAASVLGLDPSTGYFENWAEHASCRCLTFIRAGFDDLATLPVLRDKRFDLIVCFQSLMYAKDISESVRFLSDLLSPGGALVFSVPHPFRFAVLKGEIEGWALGLAYQHTTKYRYPSPWNPEVYLEHVMPRVSDYLNAVVNAELRLIQCDEPPVTEEFRRIAPDKAAWMDRYVGIMICRMEKP